MKRYIIVIMVVIAAAALLVFLVPWARHGGLSSSGPTGETIPHNIIRVLPGDGETAANINGFCVDFDYEAGRGMDEASQESVRYYFNGWNVTKDVYDIHAMEYPTMIGEPCYRDSDPLKPGWYTAEVMYEDNSGNSYEYMWNFQVDLEE